MIQSGAVRRNANQRLSAKKTSVAVSATVKCIARPIAAMPVPALSAARPQSADATPRNTSAGARPAWIHAWMHAAVISSAPHNSQPERIAWRVETEDREKGVSGLALLSHRDFTANHDADHDFLRTQQLGQRLPRPLSGA